MIFYIIASIIAFTVSITCAFLAAKFFRYSSIEIYANVFIGVAFLFGLLFIYFFGNVLYLVHMIVYAKG